MAIIPFEQHTPTIGARGFIAPDAWVTGDTVIGDDVSIFFGAVLRGDIQPIRVGRGTNIQEHAMLHTSHDLPACIVGEDVTIGHRAIIHGCTVGDRCIIGMGAVLLDGAEIGADCLIGAQSLVPMNMKIPAGHLALGVPAKVIRPLKPEEIASLKASAEHYVETGRVYAKTLPTPRT